MKPKILLALLCAVCVTLGACSRLLPADSLESAGSAPLSSEGLFASETPSEPLYESEFPDSREPESSSEPESASSPVSSAISSAGGSSASSAARSSSKPASSATPSKPQKPKEFRGVWISYLELNFQGKSKEAAEQTVAGMISDLASMNINAVILHVRSHSDAYYRSDFFPFSKTLTGVQGRDPGYDLLEIFVREAHKRGMEVHAWFNPFRAGSDKDTFAGLADNNPAKIWRTDNRTDNDTWVLDLKADLGISTGGLYYNPAVPAVRKLIIDGVREVLDRYDVDGVHFDDYFYPTTSAKFDKKEYEAYAKSASNPLSLEEWRRVQVNSLVTGVYAVAKARRVRFGISPVANVEANMKNLYADVEQWVRGDSFVDYICPQIYFGFEYPNPAFRFDALLARWESLTKNGPVDLYVGLAPYKIGNTDPAGSTQSGADEWTRNVDIVRRQVEALRKTSCKGFMLFSYKYLFPDPAMSADLKALIDRQRIELAKALK